MPFVIEKIANTRMATACADVPMEVRNGPFTARNDATEPWRRGGVAVRRQGDSPIFADTKIGTVPQSRPTKAKAKSVIQIWMWGGPSHLDTFDPKPAAGYDYCGPLNKPIRTNVDGIVIGELLPLLAKQADKYSIIRSMTHGINAHETAAYMVQTGRKPGERLVFPSVGAVVSLFKGVRRRLPRIDPALHRADRIARAILRGRASCRRATNPSPPAAIRPRPDSSSKASSPKASPMRSNATAAICSTS